VPAWPHRVFVADVGPNHVVGISFPVPLSDALPVSFKVLDVVARV